MNRLRLPLRRIQWLGIDRGHQYIKAVILGGTKPIRIDRCTLLPGQDSDPTLEDLKKWVGYGASSSWSIPDDKVERYEFSLPKIPTQELEKAIEWELKKQVPSLKGVVYDTLHWKSDSGFEVQCFTAIENSVKQIFDGAVEIGLSPEILETESEALFSCLRAMVREKSYDRTAIIDLGYSAYRFVFIHHDRVSFTRSLYFGVSTFVHQASSQLNLAPHDILDIFSQWVQGSQSVRSETLLNVERLFQESLYTLCEEFQRSESFIKEQKQLEESKTIWVCGGGACSPSTIDYLSQHLPERKVKVLNPFAGISVPQGIDPTTGALWACAVGLSIRD